MALQEDIMLGTLLHGIFGAVACGGQQPLRMQSNIVGNATCVNKSGNRQKRTGCLFNQYYP